MQEIFIERNSLPEAYHSALKALYNNGTITEVPDYNQKQKEVSMTIHIKKPLTEPRISRLILGGPRELKQYEMEVLDGILDFMIGIEENTWEYTYHNRMVAFPTFYGYPLQKLSLTMEAYQSPIANTNGRISTIPLNQINFVINELKRNPYSRRAVMSIRDNTIDSNIINPACLQHIQCFIRDNALDMTILFRSNDLPEAFFYNAWALIKLQEKIATELGVEVGTYTHRSNSMHCYEKDFKLLEGYVKGIETRKIEDLTYHYEDEFKEIMEEEIPNIMTETVDKQRAKYNIPEKSHNVWKRLNISIKDKLKKSGKSWFPHGKCRDCGSDSGFIVLDIDKEIVSYCRCNGTNHLQLIGKDYIKSCEWEKFVWALIESDYLED